jgi:hypothetical protein
MHTGMVSDRLFTLASYMLHTRSDRPIYQQTLVESCLIIKTFPKYKLMFVTLSNWILDVAK